MKTKIIIGLFIIFPFSVFAEGTKQLRPDSTFYTDLWIIPGLGGRTCFATDTCEPDQKLYIHIAHAGEKVFIGFGASVNPLNFTIKLDGNTVFQGSVSSGGTGFIQYHSQALAGPNNLNSQGYIPLIFNPNLPGDYSIDFTLPKPPALQQIAIPLFDITVIDTTQTPYVAIDGRLWSKDWGFNTYDISIPAHAFLGTHYILSEDSIVTSIYYNRMQGWNFDVTSTRNGCYPPPFVWDSSAMSQQGNHHYAQYKIFVNDPDSIEYPTGTLGIIQGNNVTVTPECDGTILFEFVVNKTGNIKLDIELNPNPGIQPEDVSFIDSVNPGPNTIIWDGLDGLGQPVPNGTNVSITISYVNGLTNLALYDVERHPHGFVIQLVRPTGPPMAIYWNDTLLVSQGGQTQLDGCYCVPPTTGCHSWHGGVGYGLGSHNSVNSWWYAASNVIALGNYTLHRGPQQPTGINGPVSLCNSSGGVYTVIPNPFPGANPNLYEWVLTDVTTGVVLFDLTDQGPSISINFSSYPPGEKRLKVRAHDNFSCYGPFGPGGNGEGILITLLPGPQITNSVNTFSQCTNSVTSIQLQSSLPYTTYNYTPVATSPFISGFSAGTANPINQILINSSLVMDSVIYEVFPSANGCVGPSAFFYVQVCPVPAITNIDTISQLCSGELTNIVFTSNVSGCTYTWTATASSPDLTGYSNGSGGIIAHTLSNSGTTSGTVTYIVTPDCYGCYGASKTFEVIVNTLLPVSVSITPSANPVCGGASVSFTGATVNGGSTPVYQWQVNGINAGTNSPIFTYVPMTNDQITCILTSSELCASGSPASSNPAIMSVVETPEVTFSPCFDTITTTNAKPIKLRGGIPLQGYYSGPGVNNGYFYPALAGPGIHQIKYSYANFALCSQEKSLTIHIFPSSLMACSSWLVDIRDSTFYPTVQIGSQCWMSTNLNYGTEIPYTTPQRDNCIPEKNLQPPPGLPQPGQGSVYQWDEVMTYTDSEETQGLCPPGWHVPSEADWNQLFAFYQGNAFAGSPLLFSGYSGFDAQLSGIAAFNKDWYLDGFATLFWSSTSHGPWKAWAHGMNDYNYSVSYYPSYRANAFSVRCIRD